MIDCNEWKTEKRHECANMWKEKDSNYDGNCTACHCLSGMYEISRRWIFVRLSLHECVHHKTLQVVTRTQFSENMNMCFIPRNLSVRSYLLCLCVCSITGRFFNAHVDYFLCSVAEIARSFSWVWPVMLLL